MSPLSFHRKGVQTLISPRGTLDFGKNTSPPPRFQSPVGSEKKKTSGELLEIEVHPKEGKGLPTPYIQTAPADEKCKTWLEAEFLIRLPVERKGLCIGFSVGSTIELQQLVSQPKFLVVRG